MPRVIKHPEIRRAEILDEAFRLFLERGYDNVSLNDLISEAGLSKGLFYHHFESKEALLLALFERISEESYEALGPALLETAADPLARLQLFLTRSAKLCLEQAASGRPIFAAFHEPESALLYDGVVHAWTERFRPALVALIEEGVAAGQFDTFDAEGVAQMALDYFFGTKDLVILGLNAGSAKERDAAAERLGRRLRLYALSLSRILGLPDASLSIGEPGFAKRLFAILNPQEKASGKPSQAKRRASAER